MSLLTLQDVSYKYEGTNRYIFNGVNMEFEPGRIYAIVGKSGAGKSTLLSLLAGLDLCTKGRIAFRGESLTELDRNRYRARSIGVVFQGFNLLTNATALENILLSMHISGVTAGDKKAKAQALLKKVGIDEEKARRVVLKLSGGEQQRVGIARALASDPELIIADEPTGNLDKKTEESILGTFTRLAHDEGKCVILVTHSKKVTSIADEVWNVEKGVFRRAAANAQ